MRTHQLVVSVCLVWNLFYMSVLLPSCSIFNDIERCLFKLILGMHETGVSLNAIISLNCYSFHLTLLQLYALSKALSQVCTENTAQEDMSRDTQIQHKSKLYYLETSPILHTQAQSVMYFQLLLSQYRSHRLGNGFLVIIISKWARAMDARKSA